MIVTPTEQLAYLRRLFGNLDMISVKPTSIIVTTDRMLNLPTAMRWCDDFGVPYEALTAFTSNGSSGCDTCGYGSSVEIEYTMELVP